MVFKNDKKRCFIIKSRDVFYLQFFVWALFGAICLKNFLIIIREASDNLCCENLNVFF